MTGPLDGIRVVEIASFVAAPFGAMMLCDLGAEVIKVEPPGGDPFRRFGRSVSGTSPVFVNSNRGKHSVVLDLKEADGQALLHQLLQTTDILICNARPAVAARLGLDDEELAAENPRLIRVYVSGYGPDGPLADAPAFDGIVQGRSGLAASQGDDAGPALATSYVVDKATAGMVCQAALAGLVARERFGIADRIDVAMLDAAVYANYPDVMANRTLMNFEPAESRNTHAAATRPIAASDGWLVVAPVTSGQIRRVFAAANGRDGVVEELLAMKDATALTKQLHDELEQLTRFDTVAHWLEAFAECDVPVAPCLDLDEHLRDAQVEHNRLYETTDWGALGLVRHVRYPATFSTWGHLRARSGPPETGEHTDALLNETR